MPAAVESRAVRRAMGSIGGCAEMRVVRCATVLAAGRLGKRAVAGRPAGRRAKSLAAAAGYSAIVRAVGRATGDLVVGHLGSLGVGYVAIANGLGSRDGFGVVGVARLVDVGQRAVVGLTGGHAVAD